MDLAYGYGDLSAGRRIAEGGSPQHVAFVGSTSAFSRPQACRIRLDNSIGTEVEGVGEEAYSHQVVRRCAAPFYSQSKETRVLDPTG